MTGTRWITRPDTARLVRLAAVPLVAVLAAAVLVACVPPNPPANCAPTGVSTQRDLRVRVEPRAPPRSCSRSTCTRRSGRPGCAASPVVVYVHGGGFRNGDKANQITDKVNLFTHEGWAFASVNYRLVGDPRSGPTNGVYPAAEQDVAAAVSLVTRTAAANRIDPHRVDAARPLGRCVPRLARVDRRVVPAGGRHAPRRRAVHRVARHHLRHPDRGRGRRRPRADVPPRLRDRPGHLGRTDRRPTTSRRTRGSRASTSSPAASPTGRARPRRSAPSCGPPGCPPTCRSRPGLSHEAVNDAVGKAGDTVITPSLMTFYRGCVR